MHKLAALRNFFLYLILFVICRVLFSMITGYYIRPECMNDPNHNYPIDVRVLETHAASDPGWVKEMGTGCYDAAGYFRTFFPLDMVFPIVYTLLMLTCVHLVQPPRKTIFLTAIFAGAIFDYLEDFSFALFLKTHMDWLASSTAIFTTLKSILFPLNMVTALILFVVFILRPAPPPVKLNA